jgi:hypothetical protein
MTRAAYNEFLDLQAFLNNLHPISHSSIDSWYLIWGQRRFLSSHFYRYQFRELRPSRAILDIWKTKCMPRIKLFAWLLLNDRLNTRRILKRRRKVLDEGYNCVMCHNSEEETTAHLFFSCPAATNRWFALGIVWEENLSVDQKILQARPDFGHPFFMDIFMIGAWCIWKQKNEVIFEDKPPHLAVWKANFKALVLDHLCRIKSSLHSSIKLCLSAL